MPKNKPVEELDASIRKDGQENQSADDSAGEASGTNGPATEDSGPACASNTLATLLVNVTTEDGKKIEIRIDPEFQDLLPHQTDEELDQLDANIKEDRACLEPLMVWRQQQVLLDGHSRRPVLQKYDIPVRIKWIDLPDRDAAGNWIINHQLGRRNLSREQASYLRGRRYNAAKQKHGGDRRSGESSGQHDHLKTADKLAEQFAVSAKTIRRDGDYADDVDTIARNCGPGAKATILSMKPGIGAREIKQIADLPPEEQQAAVEQRQAKGRKKRPAPRKGQSQTKMIMIPAEPVAGAAALVKELGIERAGKFHDVLGTLLKKAGQSKLEGKARPTAPPGSGDGGWPRETN